MKSSAKEPQGGWREKNADRLLTEVAPVGVIPERGFGDEARVQVVDIDFVTSTADSLLLFGFMGAEERNKAVSMNYCRGKGSANAQVVTPIVPGLG